MLKQKSTKAVLTLIVLVSLLFTITLPVKSYKVGQNHINKFPNLSLESLACLLNPNSKKTVKNIHLPDFNLKLPCSLNYQWIVKDYSNDGFEDYWLKINDKEFNSLNLYFYYFTSGCHADSCYQTIMDSYKIIDEYYYKVTGKDILIDTFFEPESYDLHYHRYSKIAGENKKPFPFGVGVTNHTDSTIRVIHATSQSNVSAKDTSINDEIIKSVNY